MSRCLSFSGWVAPASEGTAGDQAAICWSADKAASISAKRAMRRARSASSSSRRFSPPSSSTERTSHHPSSGCGSGGRHGRDRPRRHRPAGDRAGAWGSAAPLRPAPRSDRQQHLARPAGRHPGLCRMGAGARPRPDPATGDGLCTQIEGYLTAIGATYARRTVSRISSSLGLLAQGLGLETLGAPSGAGCRSEPAAGSPSQLAAPRDGARWRYGPALCGFWRNSMRSVRIALNRERSPLHQHRSEGL
jgi:hypothetical protein